MSHPIRRRTLAAMGALFASASLPYAASAEGLEKFAARAEASAIGVDYAPLDSYIDAFGDSAGKRVRFNFAASKDEGTDFLRRYATFLARFSPASLAGDDQLAFWLNLQNTLVLAHLSERGGRADMKKDRGDGKTPGAAWTAKVVTVDGVQLSIDDIERGVILANWKDPRVLYGLYQGSAGGPSAARKAFRGMTVWSDLEAAGERFLESSTNFQVTKTAVEVSAIFDWYSDELFVGDDAALRAHLSITVPDRLRVKFEATPVISYKAFSYKPDNVVQRTVQRQIEGGQPTFGTGS